MPCDDVLVDVLEYFDREWLEQLELISRRCRDLIRRYFRHRPLERRTVKDVTFCSIMISMTTAKMAGRVNYRSEDDQTCYTWPSIRAMCSFFEHRTKLHVKKFLVHIMDDVEIWGIPSEPFTIEAVRPLERIWRGADELIVRVGCFYRPKMSREVIDISSMVLDLFRWPSGVPPDEKVKQAETELTLIVGYVDKDINYLPLFFSEIDLGASKFRNRLRIEVRMRQCVEDLRCGLVTYASKYAQEPEWLMCVVGGNRRCRRQLHQLLEDLEKKFPYLAIQKRPYDKRVSYANYSIDESGQKSKAHILT